MTEDIGLKDLLSGGFGAVLLYVVWHQLQAVVRAMQGIREDIAVIRDHQTRPQYLTPPHGIPAYVPPLPTPPTPREKP